MRRRTTHALPVLGFLLLSSCGREASPTTPSVPTSFLQGTWSGTLTIERDGQVSSGAVAWTFDVVAGTDLRTFRVTMRSQHTWLPITTTVRPWADMASRRSWTSGVSSPRSSR